MTSFVSTVPPSPEQQELQSIVAGRYSIEREIGRGGMGVVFLARDVALDRPVAIKLLPARLGHDPAVRERFLREARTAAQLMHPNVVPIHAVEEHAGCSFFVMALIDGETVTERVARAGLFTPEATIRLMQEVAWALGYAHARGVVHRDIKPDNILIEHASGRAMVTDFGIARVVSRETLTPEGAFVGTLQFMSPEQAGGEAVDGRSDLYSLGATAYFALTGRSPVDGPTLPAIIARLMTEEPEPIATLRPEVPSALVNVISRSLQKDRALRFGSADELATALQLTLGRHRPARPEVRAFLREVQAGNVMLTIGIIIGVFAIVTLGSGVFRRAPSVPIVAGVLSLGALGLWAIATIEGLLQLRQARIPLTQVIEAITVEVDEMAELRQSTEWAEASIRRFITFMGVLMIGVGVFGVSTSLGTPLSDWPLSSYLLVPVGGLYLWLGRSSRLKGSMVFWKPRKRVGARISLIRGLLRLRPVAWLYSRGMTTIGARAATSTAPTATILLRRVEELVKELPDEQRRRLGDLLPAAAGLERAIAALRQRIRQLDRALSELPTGGSARGEFEAARARSSDRLHQGMAALEQMRTDLLRLGAGLVAADGITAELERARDLSRAIDAELHGRDEVRRLGV